jgi:hypothetical protein
MKLAVLLVPLLLVGCATADGLLVQGLYFIVTEGSAALDRADAARDEQRWADMLAWVERGQCEGRAHQAEWQAKWRWMIGPESKRYEAEREQIDAELRTAKQASLKACQREYEAQRILLAIVR